MKTRGIVLPAESGLLINTGGCLVMHATQETSGSAAAHYQLLDGIDANGSLLVPVSLSADQSTRDMFPSHIIQFEVGLFYNLVDGAVEGAVSVRTMHDCDQCLNALIYHLDHEE